MKRAPDIIEFVTDDSLLGLPLSEAQETLLRAIYGLPLSDSQLDLFRLCTGRDRYSRHGFAEVTVIAGARAGKDSRIAAPIAIYEAVFGGHEKYLTKGERGVIPLVAQDTRATRIAYNYIKEYVLGSRILSSMLDGDPLAGEISLTNRMDSICFPCTKSSLRGWSVPVGVLDELAFFALEGSADSDAEIQASVRRGMISFANTRLVKISTPYMRGGVLYDDFKTYYGKDSHDVLVWRAPSTLMNPSLKASRLEREQRLDPERFAREYLAEFTEDLESFFPLAWVDAAVSHGRHELAPGGFEYSAGVDPNGGGADAFALSIVHADGDRVVQDVCRGWKKQRGATMNLAATVAEIASTLKRYHLDNCHGDRYSAQWVVEAFAKEGIAYQQTETDKSSFYLEVEPLFAQGKIEILDHAQLHRELRLLEKRPRPGGKTMVDHPRGSHDDYANALAIAAAKVSGGLLDLSDFLDANSAAPERKMTKDTAWGDDFNSSDLHPMDILLDRARGGGRSAPDW